MSDTYISDKVNVFRGDAKSEAKNQWYSGSWIDREREQLSVSVIPGKKISRHMLRIHQAEMSPMDSFKQSIIRLIDSGIISIREVEYLELTTLLMSAEDLEYRNVLALVLSYQICNAYTETDIKNYISKGEENNVPPFDIIRYIRYLSEFGVQPKLPVKVTIRKGKK